MKLCMHTSCRLAASPCIDALCWRHCCRSTLLLEHTANSPIHISAGNQRRVPQTLSVAGGRRPAQPTATHNCRETTTCIGATLPGKSLSQSPQLKMTAYATRLQQQQLAGASHRSRVAFSSPSTSRRVARAGLRQTQNGSHQRTLLIVRAAAEQEQGECSKMARRPQAEHVQLRAHRSCTLACVACRGEASRISSQRRAARGHMDSGVQARGLAKGWVQEQDAALLQALATFSNALTHVDVCAVSAAEACPAWPLCQNACEPRCCS